MRKLSKDVLLRGLVLKETPFGEADKYLTVLTGERGKITILAKGANSFRCAYMQAAQLFCCSDFLVSQRDDKYYLVEAAAVEKFFKLRDNFADLSLAQYFVDVASEVCTEENTDGAESVLRLILNCLYAVTRHIRTRAQIKAAFELRFASIEGFMPDLDGCIDCGAVDCDDGMFLDVMNGNLRCRECRNRLSSQVGHPEVDEDRTASIIVELSGGVLNAMRYIVSSRPEKLLSFSIGGEELELLGKACEIFMVNHIEHSFNTLSFYKQILPLYPEDEKAEENTDCNNSKVETSEKENG